MSRPAPTAWALSWPLLAPHRRALGLAALLAVVIAGCRGALVWLVRDVLDAMIAAGDGRAAWLLPLAVVCLFAVQGAARIARTLLTRRAALRAEATLRADLFDALLTLPADELQRLGRGEAMSRLVHDCAKVKTAVGAAVTTLQRPLSAVAVAASAAFIAPRLAGWAALGLPVVAAVVVFAGRRTRAASRQHLTALAGLQSRLRDALHGLRTIQAYGAEDAARDSVSQQEALQIEAALRSHASLVIGPPVVEFVAAVAFAGVLAIGAGDVAEGMLTPGALVAFLVALGLLNEPLKGIAHAWGLWQDAGAGLQRVQEVIERSAPDPDVGAELPDGPLSLTLDAVHVDRGRGPILAGLTLRLSPGDFIVVSGPSGVGKSTLLDVIGGFATTSQGAILWSDQPAEALSLSARRRAVAWVDQEPWLGSGSLFDAVRLGRPGAGDEAVREALEAAGLSADSGVVESLQRTAGVGDGGEPLSGGEQQRVAIARALLRQAPILLLDEPTAHLDPEAEAALLETLTTLRPGRILLLVTHRPAPLARASRAFRLEDGRLRPVRTREIAS